MPVLFERHFSLRTLVIGFCVFLMCVFFLYYLLFQARHIIAGPVITLQETQGEVLSTSTVTLSGTTENIVSLSLNGRTIYTNDAGDFTETLVLPVGYTIMTLTAKDQYGRVRSLERTYVRKENT